MRGAVTDFDTVATYISWLRSHINSDRARNKVMLYMAWLCIAAFRKDVYASIKPSIQPAYVAQALAGRISLCQASLQTILKPGSRYTFLSGRQTTLKQLDSLYKLLWEHEDMQPAGWQKKPYRVLYRQCVTAIHTHGSMQDIGRFYKQHKQLFYMLNWAVPYPTGRQFWRWTSYGDGPRYRVWVSIYNDALQQHEQQQQQWQDRHEQQQRRQQRQLQRRRYEHEHEHEHEQQQQQLQQARRLPFGERWLRHENSWQLIQAKSKQAAWQVGLGDQVMTGKIAEPDGFWDDIERRQKRLRNRSSVSIGIS